MKSVTVDSSFKNCFETSRAGSPVLSREYNRQADKPTPNRPTEYHGKYEMRIRGNDALISSKKHHLAFRPDDCEFFAVVVQPDFVEENTLMSSDGLSIPQPDVIRAIREAPADSYANLFARTIIIDFKQNEAITRVVAC